MEVKKPSKAYLFLMDNKGISTVTLRKMGGYAGPGWMSEMVSNYLFAIDAHSVQASRSGPKPLICLRIETQSVTLAKSHRSDRLFDYTTQQGIPIYI
jgi:hypothetical protein